MAEELLFLPFAELWLNPSSITLAYPSVAFRTWWRTSSPPHVDWATLTAATSSTKRELIAVCRDPLRNAPFSTTSPI